MAEMALRAVFLSSPPPSESAHVLRRALELLSGAALLLADSVCELVWEDGSLVGAELASVAPPPPTPPTRRNTTHRNT